MRVTNDDAIYILGYKKKHRFERWFCDWTLEDKVVLVCRICWPLFLAIAVICIPIEFVYCLIESGLRSFRLPNRIIHYRILTRDEIALAEERLSIKIK